MIFHAWYKFRFLEQNLQTSFLIDPIAKVGEYELFDELFECPAPLRLRKVGPVYQPFEYYANVYSRLWSQGSDIAFLFESRTEANNYGLIKANRINNDSLFFRISTSGEYEAFVSKGTISQRAALFTMFVNGNLDQQIENLKLN